MTTTRARLPPFRTAMRVLTVVLIGAWIASMSGPRSEDHSRSPEPAADLAIADLSGNTVRLADFKGRVVLVDFWATWCDPCLHELPDVKALYRRHEREGFVILAVSVDESSKEEHASFVAENGLPYPVLLAGGAPVKGWPVRGLPTAHLIDREGRLVRSWYGYKDPNELENSVRTLLAGALLGGD